MVPVPASCKNPCTAGSGRPMSKQEKTLFMTFLMTSDMANFSGHVHGGTILKLLDQAAYACAARYCKNYVVTASLDQVIFKELITVGELVTFKANVNYVGRTSGWDQGDRREFGYAKDASYQLLLFHHGRAKGGW